MCVRKRKRKRRKQTEIMAEDVSVETLTDALTLLVNLGKVLLQKAQEEAAGETGSAL